MTRKPAKSLLAEVRPRFIVAFLLACATGLVRLIYTAGAVEQRLQHVEQDVRELQQQERRSP